MKKSHFIFSALLVFSTIMQASTHLTPQLVEQIKKTVQEEAPEFISVFKDIHQHPEIAFQEKRTSKLVEEKLKKLGYKVFSGIGKTGVVGILKNGKGPVVAYRADMDALPMEEKTELPYASKAFAKTAEGKQPVGHMCGHDSHTTWMLGLAKTMVELKDKWSGTLILIAQPAEETIEGANAMVKDGLWSKYKLPKPDYFLAFHSGPAPLGIAITSGGPVQAGCDQIDVTFYGKGGHGSTPEVTKDPIIMAVMAIAQYQAIVSRVLDPQKAAVLTVGAIHAGTSNNIIPSEAVVKINLRWYDEKVRQQMIEGIKRISNGVARIYGMEKKLPKIVMKGWSNPLINDVNLSKRMQEPLAMIVGKEHVVKKLPPIMGSEDAHMLVDNIKGVKINYMYLGVLDPKTFEKALKAGKKPPANHTPYYKIELDAIPLGIEAATATVMELMAK